MDKSDLQLLIKKYNIWKANRLERSSYNGPMTLANQSDAKQSGGLNRLNSHGPCKNGSSHVDDDNVHFRYDMSLERFIAYLAVQNNIF